MRCQFAMLTWYELCVMPLYTSTSRSIVVILIVCLSSEVY